MKILLFACSCALLLDSCLNYNYGRSDNDGDLVMLHLVFRHGDRTAIRFPYPNDPYTNLELPDGVLTTRGELTSKSLGIKFRRLYDDFLGFYKPSEVEALSSSVPRCVYSLRNVSATMYPHMDTNVFRYTAIPVAEDNLIAIHLSCPTLYQNEKFLANSQEDENLFMILSQVLGRTINSYVQILALVDYVEVMAENGHEVPDIIKPYWGQLLDLYDKGWILFFKQYKKNIVGHLINKIARDSLIKVGKENVKLHLYSGHDLNVDGLLSILDADGHVNYAGYVAFEVYRNKKEHYIEVYKDSNDGRGRKQLSIPGCGLRCPVEKFAKFAQQFDLADDWCLAKKN